jgi:hypothetical protein
MTGPSHNRKALILIALVLSGAALALTIGFAYPTPVTNTALGADWQCHRSAGIVTTCHRISHAQPMTNRPNAVPVGFQRV